MNRSFVVVALFVFSSIPLLAVTPFGCNSSDSAGPVDAAACEGATCSDATVDAGTSDAPFETETGDERPVDIPPTNLFPDLIPCAQWDAGDPWATPDASDDAGDGSTAASDAGAECAPYCDACYPYGNGGGICGGSAQLSGSYVLGNHPWCLFACWHGLTYLKLDCGDAGCLISQPGEDDGCK